MSQAVFSSAAFDAVCAASHPSDDAGGPCTTCAFRSDTEANQSWHTSMLAKLCVEGVTPFNCHEHPRLCRGWIAAVNLLTPLATDDHATRWRECAAAGAEVLALCIERAKAEQDAVPA